ncbi:MAG TPA: hypothetical protein ENL04_03855, partial [Sulfuricurvum sp.]|nr:hypothetical protein [Sulfuricurvum sp.]
MGEFVQLARQSIIDETNSIVGYELFHRDENGIAVDFSLKRRTLSAQVILSVYNLIGRERTVENKLAFYNIDPDFLNTDILEALPAEQCVFELNSTMQFTQNIIAKIKYLFESGYTFALDNFIVSPASSILLKDVLPYIKYLKVDAQSNDPEYVKEHIATFLKDHIAIAHKIETLDEFSAYKEMGFTLFEGFYIHRPEPVKHYRLEPKHMGVTRIYKMLDAVPMADFSKEFERHNELSIQLLQYLISADKKKYDATSSVRQLVHSLGKEAMKKWLMLIVYAKGSSENDKPKNNFSRFLEQRIDLMKAIVSNIHSADPGKREDELKLLALFSTLVDIYQVPYDRLTETFDLSKNIELWLSYKKG